MPLQRSSLYPMHASGTRILIPAPVSTTLTKRDRWFVYASSLFVVGSFVWIPAFSFYAYKKWKEIPKKQKRKRQFYGTILLSIVLIVVTGPHRSKKVGEWFQVKKWRLWRAWMNYVAYEVITDVDYADFLSNSRRSKSESKRSEPIAMSLSRLKSFDVKEDQSITAIIPHGLVPFSLGFSILPEVAKRAFGVFRPVVASATVFFPYVNMWLSWLHKLDASRSAVDKALGKKDSIGLCPGGISEMFEGYPKPPNTHPNDECALLKSRKGFIRMAIQHQIPVIPVYCFGASNMLRRLNLPILEKISKLLKISVCLFYGLGGLPIPFRQRLLYVMGKPILPPVLIDDMDGNNDERLREQVDEMHEEFCTELIRIFDKYKESYGWDDRRLQLT